MSKGGPSIPSDYTIKLGSDGSTIHIDSDLDNIHLKEIAPITVNSNLAVTQPIVTKSDSNTNLDVKLEPVDLKIQPLSVSSDSKSEIDIKPLVSDSCTTVKLAPLPPICVEQPYTQHFGFTFMGMELWGFNMSGKSETFLHSPPKCHPSHADPASDKPRNEARPESDRGHPGPGLRVRVK